MAMIKQLSTGALYTLSASYLVGRGSSCSLQLGSLRVSSAHASFYWRGHGAGWELRDHGSSNGTFVDARRVETGVFVRAGARIAFGEIADPFELIDDAPPSAMARDLEGNHYLASEDNALFLPDPENAVLCVCYAQGEWIIEFDDGQRRVARHGEILSCAGRRFMLTLPQAWQGTMASDAPPVRLTAAELRFTVSQDRDHIEIAVVHDGTYLYLRPRAHGELLLFLARARLLDQAKAGLPEAEHGWVYVDQLCEQLKVSESRLYVDTCRARQQFRDAGIEDADALIESRRGARRIGAGRLVIHPRTQ